MPHDKCNCSVCMRSQPLAEGPRSTASQPVCKWLLPCPRDQCLITKQHKHKARRAQILLASEAFESVSVRDASAYASSHIGSKLLLIIASVSGHTTHTCPLSKKLTGHLSKYQTHRDFMHIFCYSYESSNQSFLSSFRNDTDAFQFILHVSLLQPLVASYSETHNHSGYGVKQFFAQCVISFHDMYNHNHRNNPYPVACSHDVFS